MSGLETGRLRLRPVRADDAAILPALVTAKVGAMTANWAYPFTPAMARQRVAEAIAANAEGRVFNRLVEQRDDGAPMGWLGVVRSSADPQTGSLGYWLNDAYHGKGFLTEALRAFMPAAVAALGLRRLAAGARPDNAASIAALERLGMRFVEQKLHYVPARDAEELTSFYAMDIGANPR
jgi:RimJ/RimL family protein N-acetyltransferase